MFETKMPIGIRFYCTLINKNTIMIVDLRSTRLSGHDHNNNTHHNNNTLLTGCPGHDHNNNTLLTGCAGHDHTTLQSCASIIVDNAGSTLLPSCNNATSLQSCGASRNKDTTTLQSCGRSNEPTAPSTTLAHSTKQEAILACQTWCPNHKDACETTTITQSDDEHWHWSVPDGCAVQCPATGASSR
jgi:hypothetical protein